MVDRSKTAPRPAMPALALCVAAALFVPRTAPAADARPARPIGSLIGACQSCHGPQGISPDAGIPNLAGQKAGYLAHQLEAFRAGERKNSLMAAIAGQLGDTEIQALAQFWSQLPAQPATAMAGAAPIRSGMNFPSEFPSGFTLYESQPNGDQIARRYANATALNAAKVGAPLPAGSVIVVANHPAANAAPASFAAMEVRSGWGASVPELLRNGDWDYALFGADRIRRDTANIAPCLACHKPLTADSHVFTLKALRAAGAGLNTTASGPR